MNAPTSPIVMGRDRFSRVTVSKTAVEGIQHDYPERGVVGEVMTTGYPCTTEEGVYGGSRGGNLDLPPRRSLSSQDVRG